MKIFKRLAIIIVILSSMVIIAEVIERNTTYYEYTIDLVNCSSDHHKIITAIGSCDPELNFHTWNVPALCFQHVIAWNVCEFEVISKREVKIKR